MKMKVTMKMGDETHVMDDEEAKAVGGDNLEQLFHAKGMIQALMTMLDSVPSNRGKRIEMILEFDDGQYVVIGRKPTEETGYGT